jgi:hypothetical protein
MSKILACMLLTLSSVASPLAAEKTLPDWSGWWAYNDSMSLEWMRNPPPLFPGKLEQRRAAQLRDDEAPDPRRYCRPPQFTGFSDGFIGAVEFLFTPGRVTLTTEAGLIRRIYADGRPLPSDPDPSNTGTSVGHWEGQTLMVETVGIDPEARYPNQAQGGMPIGRNVRITERIRLIDRDTLELDVQTIAPDVLSKPDRRTRIYKRLEGVHAAREITLCVEYDRAIDPATGKQRFDMTPPADLPPPPPL